MLGWTKEPGEIYSLKETEKYQRVALRDEQKQKDKMLSKFVSPPTTSFIFASEFSGNPYSQQPPYNPSYKIEGNIVTPETKLVNEEGNPTEGEEATEEIKSDANETLDNCLAYCVIAIMVAAFIAVIACIIYFAIKSPKVARLLHKLTKEAQQPQSDSEKGVIQKILYPNNPKAIMKSINESSTS